MEAKDKRKTADTLVERAVWIRIGWMFFRMKPLTLGQIYEMGVFTCDLNSEGLDVNVKTNSVAEMFMRHNSAKLMQEIFLVCLFRRRWKRWLFRRYILKRLTVGIFQLLVNYIISSFSANFFLTSIIFLRQTNMITEPSQTTAHGQRSEE